MTEGEEFKVTFAVPGTYRYVCLPHESHGMTGTVVVR
jgi:plastocyanin